MPAEITYFNRIEPDSHGDDLRRALRAEIRDPLWMLTRQWQFGEFQGEDAGSPAFVEVLYRNEPFTQWSTTDGGGGELNERSGPLEKVLFGEPFDGTDYATRVELGQWFEELLARDDAGNAMRDAFRAAFPLPKYEGKDREVKRFLRVCGRVTDGFALLQTATEAADGVVDVDAIDPVVRREAARAVVAFREAVARVYGEIVSADPPALRRYRLEMEGSVETARTVDARFRIRPNANGEADWYSYDAPASTSTVFHGYPLRSVTMPHHIRFRGMPNHRFWDFEDGGVDFGAIQPDRRDLSRLALMDFMLTASNDWFAVPVAVAAGSVTKIEAVLVHDVFGEITYVPRAGSESAGGDRWTMFAATDVDTAAPSDVFIAPSTLDAALQTGPTLEEVRYLRDEMANMVWGVESIRATALGEPDASRSVVRDPNTPGIGAPSPSDATNPASGTALSYLLGLPAPDRWIPFLAIRGRDDTVMLRRAALLDVSAPDTSTMRVATTRLLGAGREHHAVGLYEEEVPRSGVRMRRIVHRARGPGGSTYLWIERVKSVGRGEGNSGLRWDVVVEQPSSDAA